MGLFDLFSNSSAEKAARDANAGATAGYGQLSDLFGQARGAVSGSFGYGRDALSNSFGQGRDALTTSFGQGRDALTQNFGAAGDLYKNLMTAYEPGARAYGDAAGANGPDGYARAKTNFTTDPGYGFQLDQGLQALNRTHAAAGNLSSGNADADAMKFGTGLADQSYGSYVARLLPYFTGQQTATAGAAGVNTGRGTSLNQSFDAQGNAINSNYQGEGGGVNTNFTGEGAAIGGLLQNQGNAANATQTTIGNNNAGADLNNYKVNANLWNGIMGGANFLAGGAGGQGGAGGLAKNATSLFSAFA